MVTVIFRGEGCGYYNSLGGSGCGYGCCCCLLGVATVVVVVGGVATVVASPWPGLSRGEGCLIFADFLQFSPLSVCLQSRSEIGPNSGESGAGSISHVQLACSPSRCNWFSDICSALQKSDC